MSITNNRVVHPHIAVAHSESKVQSHFRSLASLANNERIGVILMTYGSATTAEQVPEYLNHIYRGKAPQELISDFTKRYTQINYSPLIEITLSQAADLQQVLGPHYIVRAGMLHSAPYIDEAVAACRTAGATHLIGIILSPQFSSYIMSGYQQALLQAAELSGFSPSTIELADPWPTEKSFIDLLAQHIKQKQADLEPHYGIVPVIFTTHSLPKRVVEKDPHYLNQLQATVDAIRSRLDPSVTWYAGYQSAGHSPEEWLKPDLVDLLDVVAGHDQKAALIVPIQFLSDHLEVLYDLDIAAQQQCVERNIAYHRIKLPNTNPLFIKALSAIAERSTHGIMGI